MVDSPALKNIYDVILPMGYGLIYHPVSHCRILMQLGYEPDPPFLGHSFSSLLGFGSKVMKYPSIVTYCKRVADKVGWTGLFFIGLPARICYVNLSTYVTEIVYDHITQDEKGNKTKPLNTDKSLKEYLGELTILAGAKISGVLVSYPFEVIMIRQMAEIMEDNGAGGISGASSVFTWISRIFKEEGLVGFYGGVTSKLVGELMTISIAASLVYLINNNLFHKKSNDDMKEYTPTISNMMATQFSYKYTVITTLLAVSGSSLACAIPLTGFWDAYSFVKKKNGFARGSSMLIRMAN